MKTQLTKLAILLLLVMITSCIPANKVKVGASCRDGYIKQGDKCMQDLSKTRVPSECDIVVKKVRVTWKYEASQLAGLTGYELYINKKIGGDKLFQGTFDGDLVDAVSVPPTYKANIDVETSKCESNYFYLRAVASEDSSPYSAPFCLGDGCQK